MCSKTGVDSVLSKFTDTEIETWNIPYTISVDVSKGPDVIYKDGKYYVNGIQCDLIPTVDGQGILKEVNFIEARK